MDTITLIRSVIRGLLKACDAQLAAELWAVICSGDQYASAAKPQIDWDDAEARERLIDSRAKDGFACLAALEGRQLSEPVAEAAALLATVLGQDLGLEEHRNEILALCRSRADVDAVGWAGLTAAIK